MSDEYFIRWALAVCDKEIVPCGKGCYDVCWIDDDGNHHCSGHESSMQHLAFALLQLYVSVIEMPSSEIDKSTAQALAAGLFRLSAAVREFNLMQTLIKEGPIALISVIFATDKLQDKAKGMYQ